MGERLILHIHVLAPSLNVLMRLHYRSYGKLRDKWTWMVKEQALGRKVKSPQFRVHIIREYAVHPLDMDSLYGSCKAPLDALRYANVIPDDNPNALVALTCQQFKVKTKKEERTTIIIEEA